MVRGNAQHSEPPALFTGSPPWWSAIVFHRKLTSHNLELRAKRLLSRVVHVTLQYPANFLHFLQTENIGSPDGDPITEHVA